MQRQKGQILIEALVMGFAYFTLMCGLFSCLLYVWNKVWVEHHLYESLICLQSTQPAPICKSHFIKASQRGLIGFKIKDISWSHSSTTVQVQMISAFRTYHQMQKSLQTRAL